MNLQKQNRWKSQKYIDYVKTLPCVICGKDSEPHHIKGIGNMSGGSLKAPDWTCQPMCHIHHIEMHSNMDLWDNQWEYIARTLGQAITDGYFIERKK